MTSLLIISPFLSLAFLGTALSSSLVYIWSRRNPDTRLSFLGLLVFTAPYLPWVLMAFSLVVHGIVPKDEICGVIVGHVWYFFSDVYPSLHGGHRPLDPPAWWRRVFEGRPQHEAVRGGDEAEGPDTQAANINRDIAAAAAPEVR
jgi:Derlin-2/3